MPMQQRTLKMCASNSKQMQLFDGDEDFENGEAQGFDHGAKSISGKMQIAKKEQTQ